jgi:hypothetical protein
MPATTIHSIGPQGARVSDSLPALLTAARREMARADTNAWIKRLRLVRFGDASFRQRFTYRDDSLWWFTELYLQKMRRLDTAVGVIVALDAVCETRDPARLVVDTGSPDVRDAAIAFGAARGLPIEIAGRPTTPPRHGWPGYLVGLTATLSRFRPDQSRRRQPSTVAAFVHTAFWGRPDSEGTLHPERYVGPVLDAIADRVGAADLACVGVGPRRNFRARRWWDPVAGAGGRRPMVTPIERLAPRHAIQSSRALWRRRHELAQAITTGAGIRAAALYRGCDLWPILRSELEGVALVQWPWSARAMDEAAAALEALRPEVVVTYAEAGGWGRALVLEARRRGVRSAGIQHGFIYRHWLNYLHEPDEMEADGTDRGFPAPDRTLVFDRYAAQHLEAEGRFPAHALSVTGSAGLDELSARLTRFRLNDRQAIRAEFGLPADVKVAVLAAKFSEVRDELPALFAAVSSRPSARLIVKTHPAETAAPYADLAAGHSGVAVAPVETDLARLLAIADGVVTMNSTVAIDGVVLGVPALVVGLPNNLSPFVEAGVMLGTSAGAETGAALERLLYDEGTRDTLLRRAAAFALTYEMRADGRAAERAAGDVLALAARMPRQRPGSGRMADARSHT